MDMDLSFNDFFLMWFNECIPTEPAIYETEEKIKYFDAFEVFQFC
jgi:hypothetical protein